MNLFIHRRDLRIHDNTCLSKILGSDITPIFIFDPIQIDPKKNKYFSNNLVEFMCNSLDDLDNQYKNINLELQFFEGDVIEVLDNIYRENKIKSVNFNIDYSPFSKKRDNDILKWCKDNDIECNNYEDMLLIDINSKKSLNPNSNKPYLVFTPFKNNLLKYNIEKPIELSLKKNYTKIKSSFCINKKYINKYYKKNIDKHVEGNREAALSILNSISNQKKYDECRNYLTYSTTNLSAYINLGLVSIREVYHIVLNKLGKKSGIINELYWRDFYYNILHFFPHVVGNSFKENYDKIKWRNDKKQFKAWCEGKTGFPVVDACMRQMNSSGFMHNRGRMIVASFLTKDLLIDWRWGEAYFALKLHDYELSSNVSNWQWVAGCGVDAAPYFRIFNPTTQIIKFDKDHIYIKKWVPEYQEFNYAKPMVDHKYARERCLKTYKEALR